MRNTNLLILILISVVTFYSCKIPYEYSYENQHTAIPVVEGDIIIGDLTKIYISKAVPLSDGFSGIEYIYNATVWIEDDEGERYDCYMTGDKFYEVSMHDADIDRRYKLCLIIDGNKYSTDFMDVLITPEILEIDFNTADDESYVDFYISTKGDNDGSRFYQWTYNEIWEFHSIYDATQYYNTESKTIDDMVDNFKYYCWNRSQSSGILIGSALNLSENYIFKQNLNRVSSYDYRVQMLYYINVSQKSISAEKYNYLLNVRKNSEELGGIFGPQPSEMQGNIYSENSNELEILGFISCSTQSTLDRYFDASELKVFRSTDCEVVEGSGSLTIEEMLENGWDILSRAPRSPIVWSKKRCVDCRVIGTKDKPAGWPSYNE